MSKMGSGAGMKTGTQGRVGFPSSEGSSKVHDRPRLRNYREGVTGGATSSKSHTAEASKRPMSVRGKQTSGNNDGC